MGDSYEGRTIPSSILRVSSQVEFKDHTNMGAIGYNWKSPLVFLEGHGKRGGVTMEDYKKQVLKAVVGPVFNGQLGWEYWDSHGLFQEDNAPVHGSGL